MSELKLMVPGALQLEQAGAMVEFEARKAAAIMVCLAVIGQSHRRDAAPPNANRLWPISMANVPLTI